MQRSDDGKIAWGMLYVDNERFGCGWRLYIALVGRKWVRLVEVATGVSGRISKVEYDAALRATERRAPTLLRANRIAKRLRASSKTYGHDKENSVREALAGLRIFQKSVARNFPKEGQL